MEVLRYGSVSDDVKRLKRILNQFGADLDPNNPNFLDSTEAAVEKFQRDHDLVVDGVVGNSETWPLLLKLEGQPSSPPKPPIIVAPGDDFNAPHVFVSLNLLGLDETNPKVIARFVPEWRLEGLPSFKDLSTAEHAWCSVTVNADFRSVGWRGTNNAGADSWTHWGRACPFWFGAVLPIQHDRGRGGRHVNRFLYWIDESKKIAATLDGNRGNLFCVARTDLSGSGDILRPGPRWAVDKPDGLILSMAEVLAKHPNLKVGSVGSSTR